MVDNVGQQQRLAAAVGYVFTPVVPLVILTSDMKRDPFMRRHAAQALVWTIGLLALLAVVVVAGVWMLRTDLLFLCFFPVLFLLPFAPGAYWGWRVFNGGDPRPPVLAQLAARLYPPR